MLNVDRVDRVMNVSQQDMGVLTPKTLSLNFHGYRSENRSTSDAFVSVSKIEMNLRISRYFANSLYFKG